MTSTTENPMHATFAIRNTNAAGMPVRSYRVECNACGTLAASIRRAEDADARAAAHELARASDPVARDWSTLATGGTFVSPTPCDVVGCIADAAGRWDIVARPTSFAAVPLCRAHVAEHRAAAQVSAVRPTAGAL